MTFYDYNDRIVIMSFKKWFFIFLIAINFLFLISCSNTQQEKSFEKIDTLKLFLDNKEYDTKWTTELENNRLDYDISKKTDIDASLNISPSVVSTIKNFQDPIYPELNLFGSLDNTMLSSNVKIIVDSFCTKLSSNVYEESEFYFKNDYIFNYVFFVNELKKGWQEYFMADFPQKEAPVEDGSNEQNEIKNYEKLFSKWYIGNPSYSENLILIPVRFICYHGKIDVILYLDAQGDNHIYRISIENWIR